MTRTTLQKLETVCERELEQRYGDAEKPEARERLSVELGYVRELGMGRALVDLREYVQRIALSGAIVGPGRGSAPSSIINYLLGLTCVEPISAGLAPEFFFHSRRPSVDIVVSGNSAVLEAGDLLFGQRLASDRIAYQDGLTVYVRREPTMGLLDEVFAGQKVELRKLDPADELTWSLLSSDRVAAIYGLADPTSARLLKLINPRCLADLALVKQCCGSAYMHLLKQCVHDRHRKSSLVAWGPEIAQVLEHTNGHLLFQEQAADVFVRLGGLDRVEAAAFVRALGRESATDSTVRAAATGLVRTGLSRVHAAGFVSHVATYADSLASLAHERANGLLSYWVAYAAAHFPERFREAARRWPGSIERTWQHDKRTARPKRTDIELIKGEGVPPVIQTGELTVVAVPSGADLDEAILDLARCLVGRGYSVEYRNTSPFQLEQTDAMQVREWVGRSTHLEPILVGGQPPDVVIFSSAMTAEEVIGSSTGLGMVEFAGAAAALAQRSGVAVVVGMPFAPDMWPSGHSFHYEEHGPSAPLFRAARAVTTSRPGTSGPERWFPPELPNPAPAARS